MHYNEHEPPHFHAEYHGQRAKFSLDGTLVVGRLHSPTARRLIRKWATANQSALRANWGRLKAGTPLEHISPLE